MMVVGDHIERAATQHASRIAAICDREAITYRDLDLRSSQLANALSGLGLKFGARVATLLPNSIRCIEIDFALAKAGLARVPLNPRVRPAEAEYILQEVAPDAFIYGSKHRVVVEEVRQKVRLERCIWVGDQPPDGARSEDLRYEDVVSAGSSSRPNVRVQAEDLHSIFYTSGSSGKPKGVMLSHRAIVQVAYNVLMEVGPHAPGEKILLLQPLSHGSAYFVLAYLMRGCSVVVMPEFDARRALRLLEELSIESVKMVPTMLQRLLEVPGVETLKLPRLRQVIYGGSHIATEVLRRAIEIFGPNLVQHYGQSEAPSTLTILPKEEHVLENVDTARMRSAGRPWVNVEARIVDAEGQAVKHGEVGELIVRAPHVMTGYWKRPDLTAVTLRDGWLFTNDMAYQDPEGYIHLVGRKDEMIISGGFNIAPREVEDALCAHPAVIEAAVIGQSDQRWGQAVIAFVSTRDKGVREADLIDFSRRLLGYKRPKRVIILEELPKNPNGKIEKKALQGLMSS